MSFLSTHLKYVVQLGVQTSHTKITYLLNQKSYIKMIVAFVEISGIHETLLNALFGLQMNQGEMEQPSD